MPYTSRPFKKIVLPSTIDRPLSVGYVLYGDPVETGMKQILNRSLLLILFLKRYITETSDPSLIFIIDNLYNR